MSVWGLLLFTSLLAISSYTVISDNVQITFGGIVMPMKFVNVHNYLHVLAILNWFLIIIVGWEYLGEGGNDIIPLVGIILSFGTLAWRYSDIVSGSPYEGISQWWFVYLLFMAFFVGNIISSLIDACFFRRNKNETNETGLPRNSIISQSLFFSSFTSSVFLIIGFIPFFIYYKGPFLLPIVWFLSFSVFIIPIMVWRDKNMYLMFKNYCDFAERQNELITWARLFGKKRKVDVYNFKTAQQIQREKAEENKRIEMLNAEILNLDNGKIISCEKIFQYDEEVVRIEWQINQGEIKEYYLSVKQVNKYINAYRWLCENDQSFCNSSNNTHVEKECILYSLQDYLLNEKGHTLVAWRINIQNDTNLEVIIKAQSSINERYASGWTLLLYAVANGFVPGVQLLLKYGADTEQANAMGITPVLYAVRYDNITCLKLLINAGAKTNIIDKEGNTSLMIAARYNCQSVVPILLQEGVNPKIKNYLGQTALDIAQNNQAGEIAILLRHRINEMGE